jgi:hypothetical protein
MELAEQTQLIREFMVAISPEITQYNLSSIEQYAPSDNARMCLEWAMHLAGAFGSFMDETNRSTTKDSLKAPKPETQRPRGTLHPARHDVDAGT